MAMRINKGTTTMTVARTAKFLGLASVIALATAGISGTAQAQTTASAAPVTAPVQDEFAIQFRADTMIITPVLSTGLVTSERTIVAGQKAEAPAFNNYPGSVTRRELRIFEAGPPPDATALATAAVAASSAPTIQFNDVGFMIESSSSSDVHSPGVYQIGEVQALSWIVAGTVSSIGRPLRTAS